MKNFMKISLDTNIWIFAFEAHNPWCETIVRSLDKFDTVIPEQVRVEVERNLSFRTKKDFYRTLRHFGVPVDFAEVPQHRIERLYSLGLKKGDAVIGAFCEWKKVDVFVSDNRDFLKGLSPGYDFKVMSPEEFCKMYLWD